MEQSNPPTPTPPSAGEDMEQPEFSPMAGGNAMWYSHLGRQFDYFLKKINTLLP
jgi:hypothetical protein